MGRSVFLVLALVGAFATVFVAVAVVGVYQLGRDDRPAYVASGPAGERPAAPKSTATSPAVEWKLRDGAHLDRAAAGSLAPTGASPATELPAVMALTVVDAEGLAPLVPLTDGMTFDPAALAAREISVRADVKGKVGSVRFVLDGASHLEGAPPYTIAGDGGGRAVAWRGGRGLAFTRWS